MNIGNVFLVIQILLLVIKFNYHRFLTNHLYEKMNKIIYFTQSNKEKNRNE